MKVYISHSRQNGGAAFRLSEALKSHGVEPWLDSEQIESGADWHQQVADAIKSADGLVFLIGPSGPDDRGQQFEWQQVVEEEYDLDPAKALIPVEIGGVAPLPGFLRTRKAIFVPPTNIDFQALAATIASAMKDPAETIDPEMLERGQKAREESLANLRAYTEDLLKQDTKRAGWRGLK